MSLSSTHSSSWMRSQHYERAIQAFSSAEESERTSGALLLLGWNGITAGAVAWTSMFARTSRFWIAGLAVAAALDVISIVDNLIRLAEPEDLPEKAPAYFVERHLAEVAKSELRYELIHRSISLLTTILGAAAFLTSMAPLMIVAGAATLFIAAVVTTAYQIWGRSIPKLELPPENYDKRPLNKDLFRYDPRYEGELIAKLDSYTLEGASIPFLSKLLSTNPILIGDWLLEESLKMPHSSLQALFQPLKNRDHIHEAYSAALSRQKEHLSSDECQHAAQFLEYLQSSQVETFPSVNQAETPILQEIEVPAPTPKKEDVSVTEDTKASA